jgi:hypothetical protein
MFHVAFGGHMGSFLKVSLVGEIKIPLYDGTLL